MGGECWSFNNLRIGGEISDGSTLVFVDKQTDEVFLPVGHDSGVLEASCQHTLRVQLTHLKES